ncbi:MAG TPA: hypothetical protein VGJ04_01470 [Pirellulales bacterium]
MSTISTSTSHTYRTSLQQLLAVLRRGHENYAQFVTELLADLEAMQQQLVEAETQITRQNQQLTELARPSAETAEQSAGNHPNSDAELVNKVTELESDRQALEEELENIRARAVNMSQTISDQKRQMSEDQSQWMAELRQLRRLLDKQTKWITQQVEIGAVPSGIAIGTLSTEPPTNETPPSGPDTNSNGHALKPSEQSTQASATTPSPAAPRKIQGNHKDPVLGSILSQFEFLQKDVARRRKQSGNERTSKTVLRPDKMNDR